MKNFLNNLTQRQKTSVKIIAATLLVVLALLAVLYLPKAFAGSDTAKKETTTQQTTSSGKDKESSKKNDDKKNQTSKKDDKKKDDTGKKEDKKEDTSTTSETSVTPTTGTTGTEVQNSSSSVTNTSTTNTTPAPQPIYQTIHHDEVGHWETQVISEAWDEPIYERKIIGNQTGRVYESTAEFFNQDADGSYHVGDVQVGTTHHDAVTQQVWVVDQYAWDETIIVGYK